MKEKRLSWRAIAQQFPSRSPGAVEVWYYTELKTHPFCRAPQQLWCPDALSGRRCCQEE
ncbi:hypothetical protein B0T18DRAFT_417204 [Schizothecium vesticola]|uniref:Myb-like domain-containing protein n=1 Tax=Schizothecium vesticola TaxID=314040 RepID=A0AA40BTH5_9PEZI|nr:hypothetical protein B0T18DRAFT_417204 [Schizothecium vesticola]